MMTSTTRADRPTGSGRRLRIGAVLLVAGLLAVSCSLTNAGCTGQTLTALDAQEESFFSNGDEPYVAVIQFRVTPGIPRLDPGALPRQPPEIATHIDDGDSATIPAAMAATSFPNVQAATSATSSPVARPRSSAPSPSPWRATPARGAPSTAS